MPAAPPTCMRPVTVEPSRIAAGGSASPTLTCEGPGRRIGARRHLPDAPDRAHRGVHRQDDLDLGIGGRHVLDLGRHVEDRVAPVLARDLHDHAAGLHDLAGLGAHRRHGAGRVREQLGVAQPALGDALAAPARRPPATARSRASGAPRRSGPGWSSRPGAASAGARSCSGPRPAGPRAPATSARAARSAFSSFSGSSRATSWPGVTRSPTFTSRSIIRPSIRKARLTSICAWTVPVSETVSPPARSSIVTTRTGRISGRGRLRGRSAGREQGQQRERAQGVRGSGHRLPPGSVQSLFGSPSTVRVVRDSATLLGPQCRSPALGRSQRRRRRCNSPPSSVTKRSISFARLPIAAHRSSHRERPAIATAAARAPG